LVVEKDKVTAVVGRAIDGDQYAMKLLYMWYSKDMFNISVRMTGNREDAEDVVQDSFIKAFKSLIQLKDPKIFGGWLRQIVINNCLQLIKKKVGVQSFPDEYDKVNDDESYELLAEYRYERIHESIKKLPEGCRQIFLLYTMEDYTHKQIGKLLNISESTSKSQYLRGKKLIKETLKKDNG
jgi:RNA polymerase sigma-70 factor (ECF subfamily)